MNLLDILHPECIKVPLASVDKKGVIHELVDLLADKGKVSDAQTLKDAVWNREQIRSTGIGLGLGIPHGKSAGVAGLAIAIGKPASPLDFQAIDNKPVQLVFMLASAPDRNSDHIQALARISRIMLMNDFRERIYAATSANEIYDLIKDQEPR
jgi:fructose-specific phosphotransferase system IIA component